MAGKDKQVRIELTEEQKQQLREEFGEEADAIELEAEELENRIAPTSFSWSRI